ncbi:MAG: MiaB/RimO family radical SAM methylthiotransferase, partial [Desulfatiglandales bacterium]
MRERFKVVTLGCKVNQYESFSIIDRLQRIASEEGGPDGDYAIINTCAVTHVACHQSRQAISKLMRENPSSTLLITGCYVDLYPEELQERFGKAILIPTPYKLRIPEMVGTSNFEYSSLFPISFPQFPPKPKTRARAYLKVQDGCEGRCSYCVVPLARGSYKSLDMEEVVRQAKELEEAGFEELVITGIHLGKYGVEKGEASLERLISQLISNTSQLRFRLSSIEPKEVTPLLLRMIRETNRICRHLHIPLQSGSAKILRGMGRDYLPDFYRDLVHQVKGSLPDSSLGTDVMVGFPGEDESSFLETLQFLEALPITYLHVFPYSPRKGTLAYSFKRSISHGELRRRVATLKELDRRKRGQFMAQMLGSVLQFLPERSSKEGELIGHTD